jgi:hypothetical protein
MAAYPMGGPDGQDRTMAPADVAGIVREFNASNQAHEDLWARVHQAGDAVRRSVDDRDAAQVRAREARDFHLAVQAEYPHRHAPLLRQALIAAVTVGLDGVACWFAAQALGNGQDETLLWTVLFLAVLASGEVALDYASEHSARAWRLLAGGLLVFVAGLGVLRFLYLATVRCGRQRGSRRGRRAVGRGWPSGKPRRPAGRWLGGCASATVSSMPTSAGSGSACSASARPTSCRNWKRPCAST